MTFCREIDVDDWERNAIVKGNHPDTASVVARFWSVVRGMDQLTLSARGASTTGQRALVHSQEAMGIVEACSDAFVAWFVEHISCLGVGLVGA